MNLKLKLLGIDFWNRRLIKTCSGEDDSKDLLLLFIGDDDDELFVWVSSTVETPFVSNESKVIGWFDESHWDVWISSSFSLFIWSWWGGRRLNTGERRGWREVLQILSNTKIHFYLTSRNSRTFKKLKLLRETDNIFCSFIVFQTNSIKRMRSFTNTSLLSIYINSL